MENNAFSFILKFLSGFMVFICTSMMSNAQVSPYQIPPKWQFGYKAGLDFGTSPFTISPPNILNTNPTDNSGGADAIGGLEASSTVCNPSSAIVAYCNQLRVYNAANTRFPISLAASTGSSTDGAVALPDPGNANQFYIFVANDQTGGGPGLFQGVSYVIFNTSTNTLSATTNLFSTTLNIVDESICAGSDSSSGYWIVAHGYAHGASVGNEYYVWHLTASGVTAHTTFPQVPAGALSEYSSNASIKINQCQDRIAWGDAAGKFEAYSWNKRFGTIGASLIQQNTGNNIYGLELSPNGRFAYVGGLSSNNIYQIDINTPANPPLLIYPVASSVAPNAVNGTAEIGTMQLGPNGKIYVSHVSGTGNTNAVYIGTVSSPNTLDAGGGIGTGSNYDPRGFALKPNDGAFYPNYYLGIANEGWMTPTNPTITLSAGATCSKVVHSINFQTYFGTAIDIKNSTVQWSFDNGVTWTAAGSTDAGGSINPYTYDYGGTVSKTAKVKFNDLVCNNYQWTALKAVVTSCPAPVKMLYFTAVKNNEAVLLNWATAYEQNSSYFLVQRSSDGIHFTTIGKVNAGGNSTNFIQYSYTDYSPASGINYYRLVEYDLNGTYENEVIKSVTMDEVMVQIYPNPSQQSFTIVKQSSEEINMVVTDMTGREVYSTTLSNMKEVSFGDFLAKGIYSVKFTTSEKTIVKKIVKE